jgi:cell division protease FtsH
MKGGEFMLFKRWKVFWTNNKFWVLFTASMVALIALSIFGLAFLDSFFRVQMIATLPLEFLKAIVYSVLGAWFFVILVYRYGSPLPGMGGGKLEAGDVKTTFADVIGLTEAKRDAIEVVHLIKDRAKVKRIGGKLIRGLLMVGPPGCGKTYFAKAIAHEAGVPIFSVAGSEFVEVFVGVGASRMRKLFEKAKSAAYIHGAAIIFIDELDVIGQARQFSFMGGQETNSTLNQLLVNMDGLAKEVDGNVIVIGATNADEKVLDPALLRPGRFDRKIFISRPRLPDREELFKYYMKRVKVDPEVDTGRLARKTVWRTPAEIENIIKEAALISIRSERDAITYKDISEAIERMDLGQETHLQLTPAERERVAYHEAGHLVTLYSMHPTDDVFKASIKTRGGALGVVYHSPREELYTQTRDEIYANVKVALAGFVSEKIKFKSTSNGACSDFSNAMLRASNMVWEYGMSTNGFVGDYTILLKQERMSESLKSHLNTETQKIMEQAAKEVEDFLRKEWALMDIFAQALLERSELDYDEIEAIFKENGKERISIQ